MTWLFPSPFKKFAENLSQYIPKDYTKWILSALAENDVEVLDHMKHVFNMQQIIALAEWACEVEFVRILFWWSFCLPDKRIFYQSS